MEKVDIRDIVRQMEKTLSQKSLQLIKDIPEKNSEVSSDLRKIFQILLNLVNNAVKFIENGEIRIACRADNANLEIGTAYTIQESEKKIFLSKKLVTLLDKKIQAEGDYCKGPKITSTIPSGRKNGATL